MSSFIIEYTAIIRPQIDKAIESALETEVRTAAISALEDSAQQRIYAAYTPRVPRRRYSFVHDNVYDGVVSGNTLTITAIPTLQGSGSGDLGDIIASGASNYNMPFPRPWMDEGIQEKMSDIESAFYAGMARQGF